MCNLRPNCSLVGSSSATESGARGKAPQPIGSKLTCGATVAWIAVAEQLLTEFYRSPQKTPTKGLLTFDLFALFCDLIDTAFTLANRTGLPGGSHKPQWPDMLNSMFGWLPDQVDTVKQGDSRTELQSHKFTDSKEWIRDASSRNLLVMSLYLLMRVNMTRSCKDAKGDLQFDSSFQEQLLDLLNSAN